MLTIGFPFKEASTVGFCIHLVNISLACSGVINPWLIASAVRSNRSAGGCCSNSCRGKITLVIQAIILCILGYSSCLFGVHVILLISNRRKVDCKVWFVPMASTLSL
jgi:hypothetical protein